MKIKIYVEGGGDGNALRTRCRKGFSKFFARAKLQGRMPAIVACGSRNNAFDSFRTAINNPSKGVIPLLLVDSEDPVSKKVWPHLKDRDNWDRPDKADDDQAFLMVQCMENWFLADRQCLSNFYGQYFNANALPNEQNIENIDRKHVLDALKNSTKNTKKGRYGKGAHSFDVLERLDPDKVAKKSENALRLFERLNQ